jgi:MFS family permease
MFEGVTWYHWAVVIIASCGWLFDCMDQRIFALARQSAMKSLLAPGTDPKTIINFATWATSAMILGWGTGGIIFGMMSDKIGRVKTMATTLLVYSGFTGLCGLSCSWWDFLIYRFLTGLGVGGMFGAATALVAESVPGRLRTFALGILQTLSATGNFVGSWVSLTVQPGASDYLGRFEGWRVLFFVGLLPALLIVPIIFALKEPEAWKKAKADAVQGIGKRDVGSIGDLFRIPRWRRNTLVGIGLGFAGMVGLWGIGFFSPELITEALKGQPQPYVDSVRAKGTMLQDVGSFLGMLSFTFVAAWLGRRRAFGIAFPLCLVVTMYVFSSLKTETDAYWMLPMMGFVHLSLFAGYSIYFPEIFPTRLRGTGVGFCYNTVRYLTAPGPLLLGQLTLLWSFRTAAVVMSCLFLVGLIALVWAPETKGQPLPED